jgi:hypothetical protein
MRQIDLVHSELLNAEGNKKLRNLLSMILKWNPLKRIDLDEVSKRLVDLIEFAKSDLPFGDTNLSTEK